MILEANKDLKFGKAGMALLREFEGYHTLAKDGSGDCIAYWDKLGEVWTIGYGVTEGVKKGDRMTRAEAEARLQAELIKHEKFVKEIVQVPLDQNEFDALVSFCYNLGPGWLKKLVEPKGRLNDGGRQSTASAMLLYTGAKNGAKKVGGLLRRRQAERKLFLTWTAKDVSTTKTGTLVQRFQNWFASLGVGTVLSWNFVTEVRQFMNDHAGLLALGAGVTLFLTYKTIMWSMNKDHVEFIPEDKE